MARRSSYALRLALAFAVVALVAAGLTALLVNLAFGQQFGAYLSAQSRSCPPPTWLSGVGTRQLCSQSEPQRPWRAWT